MASHKRKRAAEKDVYREDCITILNAVVAFKRQNRGATPSLSTIKPVYDSIKDSLHRRIDSKNVANRIRHLRWSYRRSVLSGAGPAMLFDRTFSDLCRKAFGPMEPPRERNKNGNAKKFKILGQEMRAYWEKEKLDVGVLEAGLRFVNELKAKELEERWKMLLHEELEITAKSFKLKNEICKAIEDDTDEEDEGKEIAKDDDEDDNEDCDDTFDNEDILDYDSLHNSLII